MVWTCLRAGKMAESRASYAQADAWIARLPRCAERRISYHGEE